MKNIRFRFIFITVFTIVVSSLLALSLSSFITSICGFFGVTLPKLFGVALKECSRPSSP